jgi:hypothetical protein
MLSLYCLLLPIITVTTQQAEVSICTSAHKPIVELEAHAGKRTFILLQRTVCEPPSMSLQLACSYQLYSLMHVLFAEVYSIHKHTQVSTQYAPNAVNLLLIQVTAICPCIYVYIKIIIQIADPDLLLGPTHRKYNLCHYCKDKPAGLFLTCQEVYTHSTYHHLYITTEIANHTLCAFSATCRLR